MSETRIELENLTPIISSGARLGEAELRPGTVKQLLRWWLRAGAGRAASDIEDQVFGSQKRGAGVRVHLDTSEMQVGKTSDYYQGNDGLVYVAHTLRDRQCISPGPIAVRLTSTPRLRERGHRALAGSLWLLTWLGGIGARSRRGFGSLHMRNEPEFQGANPLKFRFGGGDVTTLAAFLETNLRLARTMVGASAAPPGAPATPYLLPRFSTLVPGWARIFIGPEEAKNPREAHAAGGAFLRAFRRNNRGPEYLSIKAYLLTGSSISGTVGRAAFGLPLQFFYRSVEKQKLEPLIAAVLSGPGAQTRAAALARLGGSRRLDNDLACAGVPQHCIRRIRKDARAQATAVVAGEAPTNGRHDRRASPLMVKVVRLGPERYVPLYVLLKSELLPGASVSQAAERLRIRDLAGAWPQQLVSQPGLQLLDDFSTELLAAGAVEVPL